MFRVILFIMFFPLYLVIAELFLLFYLAFGLVGMIIKALIPSMGDTIDAFSKRYGYVFKRFSYFFFGVFRMDILLDLIDW